MPEGTSTVIMPAPSSSVSPSGAPDISPTLTSSVHVAISSDLIVATPTPVPSGTTEPLPIIVEPQSDSSLTLVLATGVAVGLVVALVVVAIVIVVMLLVCRVKKHRRASIISAGEFDIPLENPTYREGTYVADENPYGMCVFGGGGGGNFLEFLFFVILYMGESYQNVFSVTEAMNIKTL